MESISLQFLNSEWSDWRGSGRKEDLLDRPGWLESFMARWELHGDMPIQPETRAALGELRRRMRKMTEALNTDRNPREEDLNELNRIMKQAPYYSRLVLHEDEYRMERKGTGEGWPAILGQIALSFAELLANEDDRRRVKICANEDCRWVYYDQSRSRTARWCSETECGNLMKVRSFRKRKKEMESKGEE